MANVNDALLGSSGVKMLVCWFVHYYCDHEAFMLGKLWSKALGFSTLYLFLLGSCMLFAV